jgi:hypothetical protein
MTRSRILMLCGATLLVAGCGSGATAATSSPTPSATGRGAFGGGASGQLVQMSGQNLTLSTTNGDVTVTYTSTTPITQTSTGVSADIVAGTCVAVVGTKDSTGAVTATSVRLSQPVSGACTSGNGIGGGGARPSGAPGPSGVPTPNPNTAIVTGLVTAVNGTAVTIRPATGAIITVTVPTTVTVNESQAATASDLVVDDCLLARGAKNSAGVIAATALTIEPATSNGTCTVVGRGGFGGFGRGGGTPPTPGA